MKRKEQVQKLKKIVETIVKRELNEEFKNPDKTIEILTQYSGRSIQKKRGYRLKIKGTDIYYVNRNEGTFETNIYKDDLEINGGTIFKTSRSGWASIGQEVYKGRAEEGFPTYEEIGDKLFYHLRVNKKNGGVFSQLLLVVNESDLKAVLTTGKAISIIISKDLFEAVEA